LALRLAKEAMLAPYQNNGEAKMKFIVLPMNNVVGM